MSRLGDLIREVGALTPTSPELIPWKSYAPTKAVRLMALDGFTWEQVGVAVPENNSKEPGALWRGTRTLKGRWLTTECCRCGSETSVFELPNGKCVQSDVETKTFVDHGHQFYETPPTLADLGLE